MKYVQIVFSPTGGTLKASEAVIKSCFQRKDCEIFS